MGDSQRTVDLESPYHVDMTYQRITVDPAQAIADVLADLRSRGLNPILVVQ